MLAASFLAVGCNQSSPETTTATATTTTETTATSSDNIVGNSLTDKEGNKLDMSFDNTKGTATIQFKGETAELVSEKPASGIWYKNDQYELRGKGNDIQLKKNGQLIFEHEDEKVDIEAKDAKGAVLNMTFNNTDGTAKAYLNGGEQIDLTEEKSASGIWYKNDQYELSGKGDKYTLKKDGKTVFEN